MVVTETIAGINAVKTAFDMAKALQNIHDATARDRAVIDLQREILSAQAEQFALVQRVHDLEKKVIAFETWDTEKQKYELKQVYLGAFACVPKPVDGETEPPHWLCATCFSERKKSILQYFGRAPGNNHTSLYKCQRHECGAFVRVDYKVSPDGGGSAPS